MERGLFKIWSLEDLFWEIRSILIEFNPLSRLTGQYDFVKAKALYHEIKKNYDINCEAFNEGLDIVSRRINSLLDDILIAKQNIKRVYLPCYSSKLKQLKSIRVNPIFHIDEPVKISYDPDSIKKQSELFVIDFDNNPISSMLKALVSLGFWSRKQAQETLMKVEEERWRLREEVSKMNSILMKYERIAEALEIILSYFGKLTSAFSFLLNRIDNSVKTLQMDSLIDVGGIVDEKMSVALLPQFQIDELQCADMLSKILSQMANASIMPEKEVESDLVDAIKDSIDKFNKV